MAVCNALLLPPSRQRKTSSAKLPQGSECCLHGWPTHFKPCRLSTMDVVDEHPQWCWKPTCCIFQASWSQCSCSRPSAFAFLLFQSWLSSPIIGSTSQTQLSKVQVGDHLVLQTSIWCLKGSGFGRNVPNHFAFRMRMLSCSSRSQRSSSPGSPWFVRACGAATAATVDNPK